MQVGRSASRGGSEHKFTGEIISGFQAQGAVHRAQGVLKTSNIRCTFSNENSPFARTASKSARGWTSSRMLIYVGFNVCMGGALREWALRLRVVCNVANEWRCRAIAVRKGKEG
jgi:hypothetical protein